jgi:hypothetical protein
VITIPESLITMPGMGDQDPGTTDHDPGIGDHVRPESLITMLRNTQIERFCLLRATT